MLSPFFVGNIDSVHTGNDISFFRQNKNHDHFFFNIQAKFNKGNIRKESNKNEGKGLGQEGNSIQRKCKTCEKEVKLQAKEDGKKDDEQVITKSNVDTSSQATGFSHSLNQEKGKGHPLPESTRSDMESSFGTDFSEVKIHSGAGATKMNQSINAQAFTHGQDIFFNEGKYNTNTSGGKHLLAHELTHVVQQKGSDTIQRAIDPELRVTGKYEGAAGDNDSVYFDYDSSAIDPAEESKITTLAAHTSRNYDMVGFSSEEGSDTGNQHRTNSRLNTVDRKFSQKGHTGNRDKKNQFRRGTNKLDYRRLRRVDIIPQGVPSSEPDCSASPTASCGTSFTDAYPLAILQVSLAYSAMNIAPLVPSMKARVDNAVAAMFGDASHYNTVKGHLGNLLGQIGDQPSTVRCHNSCDSSCQQADAYMDGTTGAGAVLTLCSPFYSSSRPGGNSETLIHEALHATPGLQTQDLAYGSERGITFLDSATALRNTDSYVRFIQELNNPGSVLGGGGGNRDVIDAAITGSELADMRRVMAYLEKWVIESTAEVSSLYDIIVEVIRNGTWAGVSFPYYQTTMSFLAPLFGLTVPTSVPTEIDQVSVAGIYDRLMRMDNLLWGTNIEIMKDPGPVHFASGPSQPLKVNDAFLTSGQHAMVYLLINKLVAANTAIGSGHKAKYVALIEAIRNHAGHSAPPP